MGNFSVQPSSLTLTSGLFRVYTRRQVGPPFREGCGERSNRLGLHKPASQQVHSVRFENLPVYGAPVESSPNAGVEAPQIEPREEIVTA